jgi:hypothetical protein
MKPIEVKLKTVRSLLKVVSEAYDCDGVVWQYYKYPDEHFGDTLAKFVAIECQEVAEGEDNKAAAMLHAMDNAVAELTRVRDALYNVA